MADMPVCPFCNDRVTPAQRASEDGLLHAYCAEQQAVALDDDGVIVALHGSGNVAAPVSATTTENTWTTDGGTVQFPEPR